MKRILLLGLALGIGAFSFAQNSQFKLVSTHLPKNVSTDQVAIKSAPSTQAVQQRNSASFNKDGRLLTFVPIGESGNAYGFYGDPRTYLWADDYINSVVFTHRMVVDPPGSYGNSRVSYDVSWEGGMDGTWTNNIQVYEPLGPGGQYPDAAGRYPQGAIYNPQGNTDPANAYYAYFIPTLDGTNVGGNWGGYGYGTNHLQTVDPPAPTQHNSTSSGNIMRLIPDAFTIQQTGDAWMIDGSFDGGAGTYLGTMIWDQGVFSDAAGDYEYDEWTTAWASDALGWNDSKIAFGPDGQIGYFCVMMDDASMNPDWTNYHPALFLTEDGGESWSDDVIHCQLGGEDGIASVKSFISDEVLEAIYGAGYNRDELYYNMGFHVDMSVCAHGDAHLTGLIACATEDGWYPNYESSGTFHLWYDYEEETWDGNFLYFNKTFDGDLGGISEYNRPQISTDMMGHFMFFSWIDTDLEGVETNTSPDIYCVGYDPNAAEPYYTEVFNVTAFTQAMWTAYWGSQSHYVFSEDMGSEIEFTIPFVYEEADPEDPAQQVAFWYLDGFTITFPDYWEGVEEFDNNLIASVDQNYPNPFNSSTTINVELADNADLSIEVTNLIGQKIYEMDKGNVPAGTYEFVLSADNFSNGVYFYTVRANENKITKKMIVE